MRALKLATLLVIVLLLAVSVPLVLAAVTSDRGLESAAGPIEPQGPTRDRPYGLVVEETAAVAVPEVWVEPAQSTVMLDGVFSVEVMKDTTEALRAYDLNVTWDVSKLRFVGVERGVDVDAGSVFSATLKPPESPAPSILHVTALLPGADLMAAGEGAMVEIEFEAIDTGTSLVDVIDEEDAIENVYTAVQLVDTDENTLPAPEVSDGNVVVGRLVFLPLILKNH